MSSTPEIATLGTITRHLVIMTNTVTNEGIQTTDLYIKITIEVGDTPVMGVDIIRIGFFYVICLFSLIELDYIGAKRHVD